ncbi:MAG: 16S rRNA (cytidine(1402)-2'-O)-methyltransferase [Acidimicrobiales bacterium]
MTDASGAVREEAISSGRLVLVATPIGNLADISRRAIEMLSAADVICCEDTRHSGQLLARLGIRPRRLLSVHGHNEAVRVGEILSLLADGQQVALVTDAGTPAISDPGARIVAAAHDAHFRVSVVPGPSAGLASVAIAGLGIGRWCFEGFLPRKGPERRARLGAIANSGIPVVLYEAPGRVETLLTELQSLCAPGRLVAVCRELTKLHEEVWRGPLSDASTRWPSATSRGEFVIVLDGSEPDSAPEPTAEELASAVGALVQTGLSRRDSVAEVADRTGLARRQVYDALRPGQSGRAAGGL